MKRLIDFWNTDIINKLIVFVAFMLILGFAAILYFLFSLSQGSVLYGALFPTSVPTSAYTSTPMPTPTTAFFASLTPRPTSTSTKAPFLTPTPSAPPTHIPMPSQTPLVNTPAATSTTSASTSTLNASAASCIPSNAPQTGKVVGVIDGNTIKVLLDSDGKIYFIRYIGITVPQYGEVVQPYGEAAEAVNYKLVFAQKVNLFEDASDKDSAGRLLRYVMAGNVFVNWQMVQDGFATAMSAPPNTACDSVFQNAEQVARQAEVGRWVATPTPSSP